LPYGFASLAPDRASAAPVPGPAPAGVWSAMTDRHPERWGRDRRLRLGREFAAVKELGTAWRGQHALLLALARPGEPTRAGFIASRKGVGNAVQRNRARRRLREILRRRWEALPARGWWLVFVAFRSALTAPHEALARDVEALLERVTTPHRTGEPS
jgi:ribonuclease P protein component